MSNVNLAWDAYQQYQIYKLNKTTDAVKDVVAQDIAGAKSTIDRLERKLDQLALLSRAMYELLQESTGMTNEQLAAKVSEIDLRDGKADGKVTPPQRLCPQCDSMICATFNRCLFCGYEDPAGDPFSKV
jgi:hypothetical protein